MKTFKVLCVLILVLALPALVTAQGSEIGVTVGGKIPHALNLRDADGVRQSFESLSGEKGLALVFIRSADWCRYCQMQLEDLAKNAEAITALGYNIAVVSYDTVDKLAAFKNQSGFPYPLLSDTNSRAIKRFGILNTEIQEGAEFYGIPHPGIFLIDRDGFIRAKLFEKDFKERPAVAEIVGAIASLDGEKT